MEAGRMLAHRPHAPNPSGLSVVDRVRARDLAVAAAELGLHHRDRIHYTQGPQRWQGIDERLKAWKGKYPTEADCSAFVTWCLWNGLDHFHMRDIVNGAAWKAGYTGTLAQHGERVDGRFALQRADVVLYGPAPIFEHTALVVGSHNGTTFVISHGSEAGPFYLPINYRSDIGEVRRMI